MDTEIKRVQGVVRRVDATKNGAITVYIFSFIMYDKKLEHLFRVVINFRDWSVSGPTSSC